MNRNFIVAKATLVRDGEILVVSMRPSDATNNSGFTINGKSAYFTAPIAHVMYVPAELGIKVGDNISLDMNQFVIIDADGTDEDGRQFTFKRVVTKEQHKRYLAKQAEKLAEQDNNADVPF